MSLTFGILGCGPSGLMAAHAVKEAGFEPIIFSVKKKSRQYGAQWLHQHIPGINDPEPEGHIHYFLRGDEQGYAEKVYGRWDAPTSYGEFEQDQPAWDLRSAYGKLWDKYEGYIFNAYVTYEWFEEMYETNVCDYWINSIPMKNLCYGVGLGGHHFESQPVWAGVARDNNSVTAGYENWVIYSGDHTVDWYRKSNAFGHVTIEYPFEEGDNPPDRTWLIHKPLRTNCDCWMDVLRVGRYGTWQKGVLTHDAYNEAREFVLSKKVNA